MPVPGLPTLPVKSARFESAMMPSVPWMFSVSPRPWNDTLGLPSA